MDTNLIYEKTSAGEEAMRQRTRLVQRHMRMVLILVDGRASVGELGDKVGNHQLVESALADLEKEGYIAPLLEQPSVWDKGAAAVQKVKDAAIEQFSSFGSSGAENPPSVEPVESAELPRIDGGSISPASEPFAVPETPAKAPPTVSWLAGMPQKESAPEKAKREKRKPAPAVGEDTGIRPIRRGGHRSLGIGKMVGLGFGALVVVAVGGLLLYPYDNYRPEAEAVLTRVLHQPVQAGHLGVSFAPAPRLVLENVRVGEGEGIAISQIRFLPELGNARNLKSVELVGVRVPVQSLASLPSWVEGSNAAGLHWETLQLREVSLQLGSFSLGGLAGNLSRGAAGATKVSLQTGDRTLSLELGESQGGVQVTLDGQGWEPVAGGPLRFDSLTAQGQLGQDGLRFSGAEARVMEGTARGGVSLVWSGSDIRLDGDLLLKHLSARRLAQVLGQKWRLEGEVDGNLRLGGRAPELGRLSANIQGDGSFTISRGALPVDLAEAVRRASADPLRGGETRFEQMSGRLHFDADGGRLSEIALAAGLLRTSGAVSVNKEGALAGNLDVQVGGRGNMVRMPLVVGGTSADPFLRAGRR